MRLSKIKLSGFKSFVDPTIITFPSNLVGVVGPNGCGKSNVIDAVRWVMGESSASRLRGDSITDVIFKGSSSRKPVGAATVELLFDNSSSTIKGEYSKYNEISIRRVVSRDGISNYYLNGVRCRRKDITGIFLGTGLGPRSYSIIEQGMISRVIEAKPEDMRIFIEEAAGISKYKERRKETSNRIGRTKENLDRLLDVIDEVEKQINHLKRQAKTAERYKQMRYQERQISASILAIRIRDLNDEAQSLKKLFSDKKLTLESNIAEQRKIEAEIESLRTDQSEKNDNFNAVQANYYKVGSEISRLEQSIEYSNEIKERQKRDLENANENEKEIEDLISQDKEQITSLESHLELLSPNIERAREAEELSKKSLSDAEEAIKKWQQKWDNENLINNEFSRDKSIEQNRLDNLKIELFQLKENEQQIDSELCSIDLDDIERDINQTNEKLIKSDSQISVLQESIDSKSHRIEELRNQETLLADKLDQQQIELRKIEDDQIKLMALQETTLADKNNDLKGWIKKYGFKKNKRVIQDIEVSKEWQFAVETVLGENLAGLRIDSIQRAIEASSKLSSGKITFINDISVNKEKIKKNTLASKIKNAPNAIYSVLENIFIADSIDQAISLSEDLEMGESVITNSGIWVSKEWVRIFKDIDTSKDNAISRENKIKNLSSKLKELSSSYKNNEKQLFKIKNELKENEHKKDELQKDLPKLLNENTEIKNNKNNLDLQFNQINKNKEQGAENLEVINSKTIEIEKYISKSEVLIMEFEEKLGEVKSTIDQLKIQKDNLDNELSRVRNQYEEDRSNYQEMQIKYESKITSKQSASQNLDRMLSQKTLFQSRKKEILEQIDLNKQPLIDNKKLLEEHLQVKVSVEKDLNHARTLLENVEGKINQFDQNRLEIERKVNESRSSLSETKESLNGIEVREEEVMEQLSQTEYKYKDLIEELSEDNTLLSLTEKLENITSRINRLGPINLAAIDELDVNTERKEYLDSQLDDLNSALSTLEGAIRKIDSETRSRFRETFNKVNSGFEKLFPKLFGGGQAYMELIGNDLLTAGVTVMARPPGKRNSSINLLSGGEKALTAVALVFAIFELNPSPFCMLDEVDAPLDDTNVNRFCEIVDDMSKKVQFIFITHNKITMEMAKQLSGVTMQEPGVSRLVSVDIDEAVKMTAN